MKDKGVRSCTHTYTHTHKWKWFLLFEACQRYPNYQKFTTLTHISNNNMHNRRTLEKSILSIAALNRNLQLFQALVKSFNTRSIATETFWCNMIYDICFIQYLIRYYSNTSSTLRHGVLKQQNCLICVTMHAFGKVNIWLFNLTKWEQVRRRNQEILS